MNGWGPLESHRQWSTDDGSPGRVCVRAQAAVLRLALRILGIALDVTDVLERYCLVAATDVIRRGSDHIGTGQRAQQAGVQWRQIGVIGDPLQETEPARAEQRAMRLDPHVRRKLLARLDHALEVDGEIDGARLARRRLRQPLPAFHVTAGTRPAFKIDEGGYP